MTADKLFTKSAFKIALDCPNKLYYYRNPDLYENKDEDNDFLASLAEGGFQVGELAKIYCEVPTANDIKEKDYASSLERTKELMEQKNVNIAEAAFRYGNLFVRVDVLRKVGNNIDLIEVKAKSWNPDVDKFVGRKNSVASAIRPYVYDVAFQKYVVTNALKELYPDQTFEVRASLMMADKSKRADIDGINQLFKITKKNGQSEVEIVPGAKDKLASSSVQLLTAFDVDTICDDIINGRTGEQNEDNGWMENLKFEYFVKLMSEYYCENKPYTAASIGTKCFGCQFCASEGSEKSDGYKECWKRAVKFSDADFAEPLVKDLWGGGGNTKLRGDLIKNRIFKQKDITTNEIPAHNEKVTKPGLDANERKWLQIAMSTGNKNVLRDFASDIHDGAYLDIEGLREEMKDWHYPLHMIDFETTAVALPFYKGMRPYEQVAFQFSHHIIYEDGRIEHAGQYLNNDVTKFPNFEFVRELKKQLCADQGTIFRYATHENSILNTIANQLEDSSESDKGDLIAFIRSITHVEDVRGERDMVDLLEVVKRYFYEPKEMGGSNSIKVVLPAVLNVSQYLKDKYSKPVYGRTADIPSCNHTTPIAWIEMDDNGHVENPYHLLEPVAKLAGFDEQDETYVNAHDDEDEFTVANGGAALTAYSKMMFCDGTMSDALREALLRYCELDTMAMVFIWEYFHHECAV